MLDQGTPTFTDTSREHQHWYRHEQGTQALSAFVVLRTVQRCVLIGQPSASHLNDAITCLQDLINIAKTTLSSKILTGDKVHFADLAVDAVLRLKGESSHGRM